MFNADRIGFVPRFVNLSKRIAKETWDTRDEPETLSRRREGVDVRTS